MSTTEAKPLKKIYISGKYTAKDDDYNEVERHICLAREAALMCAENGVGFYCPHTHSAHFELMVPDVSYEFWMQMCLDFLTTCDCIYMLPNWMDSSGGRRERQEAEDLGLPVFYALEEAIAWALAQ